jgi:hypothetical protein
VNLLEIRAGCANKERCAGLKSAGGAGSGFRVELGEPATPAAASGRLPRPVVCDCIFR